MEVPISPVTISPPRVEQARSSDIQTLQEARQTVAIRVYSDECGGVVRQTVCDVWTASRVDCTCFREPVTRDSQNEGDPNYPYRLCEEAGGDIANVRMQPVLFAC